MSYTVFLALNSEDFACVVIRILGLGQMANSTSRKKWGIPRLSLGSYLFFCAFMSFAVTIWLFFIKEVRHSRGPISRVVSVSSHPVSEQDKDTSEDIGIKAVYVTMWGICKLRRLCTFS